MTVFCLISLWVLGSHDLVNVKSLDARFVVDMRYATSDNFLHKAVYPINVCLIRSDVGRMLQQAQRYLDTHKPGWRLMFKDCYRPEAVQFAMWEIVKNTSQAPYVANPYSRTGSVHNYGAAVDITMADEHGVEIDMGTPHDFLGKLAEPRLETHFLKLGTLTQKQLEHRKILRRAMTQAGFHTISNEWWHFDALQGKALRAKYTKLNIALTSEP